MTTRGRSRRGAGHVHASTSRAAGRSVVSDNGGRLPGLGGGHVQPPVEVVRGAGSLTGDHGGSERRARGAQGAEGLALVRLEQPLENLSAAALGGFLGPDAVDREAVLGVVVAVLRGQPP